MKSAQLQDLSCSYSNQDWWPWQRTRDMHQWNTMENSDFHKYIQLIFGKGVKTIQ